MTKIDWENITNYIDAVGTTDTVFPFIKTQSSVVVKNGGGTANLIYTIGSQSGTLSPGQSITVLENITSMTLRSSTGKQDFQVWATEAGTEKDEESVAPDLTGIQSQVDSLETSLAQKVSQGDLFYTTQGNSDGVHSDSTNIQNALNGNFKTVILKSDCIVDATITIPNGKTLDLGNNTVTIKANVDGFYLNDSAKIKNGTIIIDSSIASTYTKSVIILKHVSPGSRFQKVNNLSIFNTGYYVGTAIKFDVGTTGANIAYSDLTNFKIKGFNLGVDITIPNVSPHVAGSGYDNWITTCKIDGFISAANQGIRLEDQSNNGSSIQGMDIFVRGQAGNKNANYDEAIFAKCSQSTFNVILDDAAPNSSLVTNFIVFDSKSTQNTYLGPNEKVVDNGTENIILNSSNYVSPSSLVSYSETTAKNLGVINTLLYHADKRFTVTTTKTNCTDTNPFDCFKYGSRNTSWIITTDSTQQMQYTLSIDLGGNKTIRTMGISLHPAYLPDKVKFRAYSGNSSTWFDSGWLTAKEVNTVDVFSDLSMTDYLNVSKLEFNILNNPNTTKSVNVILKALYAFGGSPSDDRGNLLSKNGGTMYGNLNMGSSYIIVGNVTSLPTASATYRGYMALVPGNGTTTADVLYMCLMNSTGVYNWKNIIVG